MSWVPGILQSLIASIIFCGVTLALSPRFRRHVVSLICKLIGVDVVGMFKNKEEAAPEIAAELLQAQEIKILTSRGKDFQYLLRPAIDKARGANHPASRFRILLPDPSPPSDQPNWTAKRGEESINIHASLGRLEGSILESIRQKNVASEKS